MCVVGGRCCRCWSRVGTAGLRPLVRRCAWRCPPPCSCYSCISFFPSHSGPIALRTRVCLSCFSYLRALVVAPPVFLLSALTCLRWRAICVSLAYRLRSTFALPSLGTLSTVCAYSWAIRTSDAQDTPRRSGPFRYTCHTGFDMLDIPSPEGDDAACHIYGSCEGPVGIVAAALLAYSRARRGRIPDTSFIVCPRVCHRFGLVPHATVGFRASRFARPRRPVR